MFGRDTSLQILVVIPKYTMSALRLPLCMTFFPIINKGKPGKFYPIFPHLVVGKKRLQDSLEQMSDLTVRKTD